MPTKCHDKHRIGNADKFYRFIQITRINIQKLYNTYRSPASVRASNITGAIKMTKIFMSYTCTRYVDTMDGLYYGKPGLPSPDVNSLGNSSYKTIHIIITELSSKEKTANGTQ